jgi:hypothetical protein
MNPRNCAIRPNRPVARVLGSPRERLAGGLSDRIVSQHSRLERWTGSPGLQRAHGGRRRRDDSDHVARNACSAGSDKFSAPTCSRGRLRSWDRDRGVRTRVAERSRLRHRPLRRDGPPSDATKPKGRPVRHRGVDTSIRRRAPASRGATGRDPRRELDVVLAGARDTVEGAAPRSCAPAVGSRSRHSRAGKAPPRRRRAPRPTTPSPRSTRPGSRRCASRRSTSSHPSSALSAETPRASSRPHRGVLASRGLEAHSPAIPKPANHFDNLTPGERTRSRGTSVPERRRRGVPDRRDRDYSGM